MLGSSFKDIEKAMRSILEERQPSAHEEEIRELEEIAPYKLQKEELFPQTKKYKKTKYTYYTEEEVKALMEAEGNKEITHTRNADTWYDTYSPEQVAILMQGRYKGE